MPEVAFDTHAEIRKLERAGCPTAQAEAMVDLVSRAPLNIQMVKALERLAFQVETNMATKADIARLEGEIAGVRADRKADIAGLCADMFRALWIQGAALAAFILALAGLKLGFDVSSLLGS